MIDLHCHILPGIDDGPETLEESLAMCRVAAADGVRAIVATPHYKPGSYEWSWSSVVDSCRTLEETARENAIDIRIIPGAEVAISPELQILLEGGGFRINGGRYFLIEFRPHSVPAGWEGFLLSFLASGTVPIIAHPERNEWFASHPDALAAPVRKGVLLQVTAGAITGELGKEARDFSAYLLRHNLVHTIGSDAHSPDLRPPVLSRAARFASDLIGRDRAAALVISNPEAIISGRRVPLSEPVAYAPAEKGESRPWFQRLFT